VGRHSGKFKWKKYSKYSGNLKKFWTAKDRPDVTRHRRGDGIDIRSDTSVLPRLGTST
jgi:hypothetical protein